MTRKVFLGFCLAVTFAILQAGCAQYLEPKAEVTTAGGPTISEAQAEAYDGPKARVAVSQFTDKTGKGWWTGGIGDGMADMLATALFNTNRYIVLERKILDEVLAEQDLGASGRIKKETAAPIGEIEGAELLITGAVTEFEPGASGGIGGFGGVSGSILGGILGSLKKAHMAIDVRVVDTRTSRIVAAASIEGSATDIAGIGVLAGGNLGGGLAGWKKTPLEKALRVCITEATNFIVSKTPSQYYHYGGDGPPAGPPKVGNYQSFSPAKEAYVKGQKVNIRAGAGTEYSLITQATTGDPVTALGKQGSWYKVKLASGDEGWIYEPLISFEKPAP